MCASLPSPVPTSRRFLALRRPRVAKLARCAAFPEKSLAASAKASPALPSFARAAERSPAASLEMPMTRRSVSKPAGASFENWMLTGITFVF
jgi:hypothetical protein